ncbi:WRKY transcription factor [Orobanche minor]
MMDDDDDDWDLHAVVRGCAAASTTTTATDIPSLPSFSSAEVQNPLDFLKYDNNDPFRGLRELGGDHAQTSSTTTTCATGSISIPAAHNIFDQPRQNIMQILKPPLRMDILDSQENIQFSNPGIGSSSSHNLPATNPQPSRQRRIRPADENSTSNDAGGAIG